MSTDDTRPMEPSPKSAQASGGGTDPEATRAFEPPTWDVTSWDATSVDATSVDAKAPAYTPKAPSFQPSSPSPVVPHQDHSPVPPPPPLPPSSASVEPGWPGQPAYGSSSAWSGRRQGRRRRRRRTMGIFAVVVILVLLAIADLVAKAIAENNIASQIRAQDPQITNPSVSIPGFPFLPQVIARDIHEIDISASNVPAGPVTITSVKAVAKGVHVNGSFNGGKVDTIDATVFIGFNSLSSALASQTSGIGNVTLSDGGNGDIKASFSVLGASVLTETAKVTLGGNQVSIAWQPTSGDSGGLIGQALGGATTLPNMAFPLPKLPAGVNVTSLAVTQQGIVITGDAHNQTL